MTTDQNPETAIAIIGLAARFPGADNETEYWRMLAEGREGISRLTAGQLRQSGVPQRLSQDAKYVAAGGVVRGIDLFDADLFGLSPMAAQLLDPQHRLLLHCAWAALEDAACDHTRFDGAIGVFAGQGHSDYATLLEAAPGLVEKVSSRLVRISTDKDHLATRVSYTLGLTGPSVTVQTACSTSLVAVHMACQSLLDGHCDVALAGGVSLRIPQEAGYLAEEGVIAGDGHCRTFDAAADGSVPSGGAGLVTLKPLSAALTDGDPIRAVIIGSAVNNDGSAKVGYTAPSVDGQVAVIAEALAAAGVPAGTIGLVEAHGTATPLGDPIEITALTDAFRLDTATTGFCAIGSVKSNIGHADAAAGIAGLIKATLAVEHATIPPSLNFTRPNPEIDLDGSPFYVPTAPTAWPADLSPRRAGVSSFGLGGTNAHLILQEAPPRPVPAQAGRQLLVLSANTSAALAERVQALGERLRAQDAPPIDEIATTLRRGRAELPVRTFVTAASAEEGAIALAGTAMLPTHRATESPLPVAFLFPGLGALRPGIGAALYGSLPEFSREADQCLSLIEPAVRDGVRRTLLDPAPSAPGITLTTKLLALFVLEYSLAAQWRHWGIEPVAVAGHSAGEYAAACVAGVFDVADALSVVRFRAELIEGLPTGRMLSLPMSEPELLARLGDSPPVDVAVVNGPSSVVVSGEAAAIDELLAQLAGEGVEGRLIEVEAAGHSRLMEPIMAPFREHLESVRFGVPHIPIASGVSGTYETPERISSPGYWTSHLREPVRFGQCVETLAADDGTPLFLEVGPSTGTVTLVRGNPRSEKHHAVSTMAKSDAGPATVYHALGAMWARGVPVCWQHFGDATRSARLPVYGFDVASYWIPDTPEENRPMRAVTDEPALEPERSRDEQGPVRLLLEIFSGYLGIAPDLVRQDLSFLELGADSLMLMQVSKRIEAELSVKVPFRQLLTKYPTITTLAARIAELIPATSPEPVPAQESRSADTPRPAVEYEPEPPAANEPAEGGGRIYQLMDRQLDIVARQLSLLEKLTGGKEGDHGAARR